MKHFAFVVFTLLVSPTVAAEVEIPEGCSPIVTVMKTACTATTIMQCADGFIEDTFVDGTRIDRHIFGPNWDLRGYVSEANAFRAEVDVASGPGMSLTDLAKTGSAASKRIGSFQTRIVKNREIGVEGIYSLSDETVTLSGIEFRTGLAKRLFIVNPNNRNLDSVWEIDIYVSEKRNLFIEGSIFQKMTGRSTSREQDPKTLAFSGQEGFGSKVSPYGCDE